MRMSSVITRKFYAMSSEIRLEPWLSVCYGAATMNRIADRVWSRYGRGPKPKVVCGRGLPWPQGGYTSYFDVGENTIVLARHQRSLAVLLHELAHALTPQSKFDHGPAFCLMYARLLEEFAGEDGDYVLMHMIDAGLINGRHLRTGGGRGNEKKISR